MRVLDGPRANLNMLRRANVRVWDNRIELVGTDDNVNRGRSGDWTLREALADGSTSVSRKLTCDFEKYHALDLSKDSYFERAFLPPFVLVFLIHIVRHGTVPMPHELMDEYLRIYCIEQGNWFTLRPSCDFDRPERSGVALPPKPERFHRDELFCRVMRVWPAIYRELDLLRALTRVLPDLEVMKDMRRDMCEKADLTVTHDGRSIDLALFDATDGGVHRRHQKADSTVQLEVPTTLGVSTQCLASGLYVYRELAVSVIARRIVEELWRQ